MSLFLPAVSTAVLQVMELLFFLKCAFVLEKHYAFRSFAQPELDTYMIFFFSS